MRDFCYTGDTYIEDALYPPFDISMAVRLNTVKVENDSPSFLSGLKELQKQLGQETIAIFEIGRSIVKLHILNLLSQPPTHTKAAMRIYHIINTATKQTSNPHAAIIDSIITGRCFAHQLLSTRPTSNCVVPYATHIPPLIKRAQAYHNHLSDTTNKDRGIGSTWLPGGILAVAEGRWVWDIAFPFNNQSEHQNSLIRIDESKQLHLLSSTTSGQPLEIEPAPGRNTLQPPLCQDPDQAIAAQNWSTLLGGL
jgi:hypothetical protein